MVIISFLGLSVHADKKSFYENAIGDLPIKEDNYINSIDALLQNFDEQFIFFGTQESEAKHKEVLGDLIGSKNVKFITVEDDLNKIFSHIVQVLIEYKDEEILFDITHSFRDAVVMSVLSTIVTQSVYNPSIRMIYAKELERFKRYRYELVSDELLHTSNIAMVLSTFLDTLRVPRVYSKYELHRELKSFSDRLVSNQFKPIYEKDIPSIKAYIERNRERLFFVRPLLDELEEFVGQIESVQVKPLYEQFLFFAKLFLSRHYYLQSSTYLIEGISYYVGYALKEQGYIDFEVNDYKSAQRIVELLRFQEKKDLFRFPHKYFVDINSPVLNQFATLREEVADIRNNLAHINITKEYGENIEKKLQKHIERFEELISSKILYNLDTTQRLKDRSVNYKLDRIRSEYAKYFRKKQSIPKVENLLKKYRKRELKGLSDLKDFKGLHNYLTANYDRINNLLEKRSKGNLLD